MNPNILHSFWAAALLLASVSCSQDKLAVTPDASGTDALTITVTDGGYRSAPGSDGADAEQPQTRATENGYRTEFTAGDECGLYVVRAGAVVFSNVKLTAYPGPGGSLTWRTGITLAGGMADENYFLYYPYQADMTGKVDVAATNAEEFFAPLVSGWQAKADQSTYAAYSASDLMTAQGTATRNGGNLNLSFSMTHRMALAVIEMPKTIYKFTNTTTIPDYSAATSADFTSSTVKPYCIAPGTYRCIVNPAAGAATSIIGDYDGGNKGFYFSVDGIAAGSCKTYKVDGGRPIEKSHNLQVGDFFLADGTLVGKDETLTAGQQVACVGIVFHTGKHQNDKSDYSQSGIGQKDCHGYAVALKDATSGNCIWGVYGTELGCYPMDGDGNKLNNRNNPDIDWNGYAWTQKIITAAGGKDNLNASAQAGYPATYYAVVAYETGCNAPTNSSGWFLPSIGQMWNIYQNRSSLFNGKAVVTSLKDDWYWSSSEHYSDPANNALFVRVSVGSVNSISKDNNIHKYVRPVLAF